MKISKEQLLFVHLFYQHREPIAYFFDCFPSNSPTNSPVCYRNIVLLAVLFALGHACGIMLLISLESRPLHDSLFEVLGFNHQTKMEADDSLIFYFYLSKKIRLDILCESSA